MLSGPGEPGMTVAGGIPETKRHQIPTTTESIIESSELISLLASFFLTLKV